MAYYLDTSAAVKLVVAEAGSAALTRWLRRRSGDVVSSDLLRTELLRVTRRGAPQQMQQARMILDAVALFALTSTTFERAALVDPLELRSLDSIHLAAALELGADLEGIVTYDQRLGDAAIANGTTVIAPT